MEDVEALRMFLSEQKYMTIAVVLDNGTPWAIPVRIKHWEGTVFEWDSKTDTEHSKAIAVRPTVAISMWTPEGDGTIQFGLYAHAKAEQISEPGEHGIAQYRAVVEKSYINDATFRKREVHLG